jgi:hypothetical protein
LKILHCIAIKIPKVIAMSVPAMMANVRSKELSGIKARYDEGDPPGYVANKPVRWSARRARKPIAYRP